MQDQKSPVGAPMKNNNAVKEDAVRKKNNITIRVTDAEKKKLEQNAKKEKLTVTNFIRSKINIT